MSTLIYLYGPPASGKLTIAERVAEITGAKLFHNHLTVDAARAVFEFRSDPFDRVVQRFRLDVFATAASAGIDLVFTNSSAWGGPDARQRFAAFAEDAANVVDANGGQTFFVRVDAPPEALERRLANESRRRLNKLTDVARLTELMSSHDPSSLHPTDLIVETARLAPHEAADLIVASAPGLERLIN